MNGSACPSPVTGPIRARSAVIDLWRALACLAVVSFHASHAGPGSEGIANPIIEMFSTVGRFGWLGVPLFFVISGYCLAQAVQNRSVRGDGMLSFVADRLLRIYPVYWAALLLAILLGLVATPFNGLPPTSALPSSPSAWLADLTLVNGWTGISPKLMVSWSLDYEIGFYLITGFALLAPLRRPSSRLALYGIVTVLAHVKGVADWAPLLGAWPAFACGLAVHTALQPTLPRFARVIGVLYPAGLALAHFGTGDGLAALAPLFALGLLLSVTLEPRLPAPPRALCAIGLASYSIYLVHVPFMSPALNLAGRFLPTQGVAYTLAWLGHVGLGIAAGLVFHRFVERRCEMLRTRFARPKNPAPTRGDLLLTPRPAFSSPPLA